VHMVAPRAADHRAGDLDGTAVDHFSLAKDHLGHAISLAVFGGGRGRQSANVGEVAYVARGQAPTENSERRRCVIVPTDSWKESWDIVILTFILYSAVMVPFHICFKTDAEGWLGWLEISLTIAFVIDVVLNFNTAYYDDETLVTDRGRIACRYLSGWFWIDAPSSIPVELIDMMMEGDSSNLSALRFLRLFRLLRLLRLLKINEYITTIEVRFDLNLTFMRICQMVLNLLFLAHMLGCFWFYMAVLVGIDHEITTWVSVYDDGSAVDAPASTQYLYAMYWALTTLTTVGYGDITPTNNVERTYSLFALLTGALVFGYMLSSIGALVEAIDRQAALSQDKIDEIKEYMRWRRLPRDLVMRLRRYYSYYYNVKTAFDEDAILGSLTPALRLEVVKHSLKETIGKIPLFATTLDASFQLDIYPLFKPVFAAPQEVIFAKGDQSFDLLFLLKGVVEVISGVDEQVLYRVQPGDHFGESVLTGRRRSATHRAVSKCDMFVISSGDLSELFARRPREGVIIHQSVMAAYHKKENLRVLSLRLQLNRLTGSRPQDAAALRLQLAWNRYCKTLEMRIMADNLTEDSMRESLQEHISAMAVVPPGMTRQPTRDLTRQPTGRRRSSEEQLQAAAENDAFVAGTNRSPGTSKQPTPATSANRGFALDGHTIALFLRRMEQVDYLVERLEGLVNANATPRSLLGSSRGVKLLPKPTPKSTHGQRSVVA